MGLILDLSNNFDPPRLICLLHLLPHAGLWLGHVDTMCFLYTTCQLPLVFLSLVTCLPVTFHMSSCHLPLMNHTIMPGVIVSVMPHGTPFCPFSCWRKTSEHHIFLIQLFVWACSSCVGKISLRSISWIHFINIWDCQFLSVLDPPISHLPTKELLDLQKYGLLSNSMMINLPHVYGLYPPYQYCYPVKCHLAFLEDPWSTKLFLHESFPLF